MSIQPLYRSVACLLIVDDELSNVLLLEDILQDAGYSNVHSATDPREVRRMVAELNPDLVLLDLMMPYLDGFEVMKMLREDAPAGPFLPILMLTADISREARERALADGANDFLTKPFEHTEVLLRIKNLLQMHFLNRELFSTNLNLEARVRERTAELEQSQLEVLERLAQAAEYRDDDTGQHTRRVGNGCAIIARKLGLNDEQVELIRCAAPLHDVGKIGVPDNILLKPGKLTPEEFDRMKRHTEIGGNLLMGGKSALVTMAERIARTHHERWEGSGYPLGLKEEEIPLEGRIVSVMDVFDALTHERPYKAAWTVDDAIAEITRQSGKQFDPRLVEILVYVVRDLTDENLEKSHSTMNRLPSESGESDVDTNLGADIAAINTRMSSHGLS